MYDYENNLTTAEVMDLTPEEKEEYINSRKEYRRWKTKKLKEQTFMGIGFALLNIIVPTGASILFVPLGLWVVYRAMKRDVVIY